MDSPVYDDAPEYALLRNPRYDPSPVSKGRRDASRFTQQVALVIVGAKLRENGVVADKVHLPVTESNATPIEKPTADETDAVIAAASVGPV